MNKTVLTAIAVIVVMLGATYLAVGMAGGVGGDGGLVNKLAVLGAAALVIITVVVVARFVQQMQNDTVSGKLTEETWDGIGEYKNEAPFGWSVIYLATIAWAIWYFLAGYPLNSYSQIGEYNEESKVYDSKFVEQYKNADEKTLVEMGEASFTVNCAPCHGLQADGMNGKSADLHVRLSEKSVKHAIMNGANNNLLGTGMMMPDRNGLVNMSTSAPITDAEIDAVSKYVAGNFKGNEGAAVFAGTCASCHGPDGKGMDMVAPNIAEMSPSMVDMVLHSGKKGAMGSMPAFKNFNEVQYKALDAYVASLSKK